MTTASEPRRLRLTEGLLLSVFAVGVAAAEMRGGRREGACVLCVAGVSAVESAGRERMSPAATPSVPPDADSGGFRTSQRESDGLR